MAELMRKTAAEHGAHFGQRFARGMPH